MESPDLKPTPPDDAAFDSLLRAQSGLAPLPDAGFSPRVVAALPRPRRHRRALSCLTGLAAGLAVAIVGVAAGGAPDLTLPESVMTRDMGELLSSPALGALGLAAVSVWYALRGGLRRALRF
jgi:hypothetical protein